MPKFATIAEPLITLTKKDTEFSWSSLQEAGFRESKSCLMKYPILRHFVSRLPLEIHTDASGVGVGVGAVLIQRHEDAESVVAYASKTLNRAQRNYGPTQLELYTVVFGIEKFQSYLSGNNPFKVVTDHAAILPLLKTRHPVGRPATWLLRITSYVFQVVYRPGRENVLADAYPVSGTAEPVKNFFVALVFFLPINHIEELQRKDLFVAQ